MIDFMSEVLKRKEDMLADIKTLCQIPSTLDESTAKENQPFGKACRDALDAMLEIGKRDGYEVCDVDGYAGHIDVGEGEESFGILGHLDVVPCNKVGWDYPPYDMTIVDNKLYGRGVADDKGPLIAGYYAAKIIKELNQLSLQINNLISLLSEQPVINDSEITEDNINDEASVPEKFLGSELQGDDNLFESDIEIPEGEAFVEKEPGQEMIVDDGEELILE